MKTTLKLALVAALFLALCAPPPLTAAVTGRAADSSLAGTEKLLSDSSGTDTYILLSTLWGTAQPLTAGITATGSTSWDFSGSTATFKTSTGINTFGGSAHNFSAVLQPTTNDAAALGTSSLGFSDLFLANGGVVNWNGGEVTVTHAAGVITVAGSGAGDLRVTTAGTNAASVVTVGGTQTLTNKTLTSPVINGATSSGSTAIDLSGNSGTFSTPTGTNVIGGAATFAGNAIPAVDGTGNLGDATHGWDNLFLKTGATIKFESTDWVATHSTGILTVSTGDLRVTTAGTNTASVVTVGGTQTLAAKTFTTPVLGVATATSINKVAITAPATSATLTISDGKTLAATHSITLAGTDSTTMTFPATSSTVMSSSLSSNSIGVANSVWGASNALVWEGTDDASETTLAAADATADTTLTLPAKTASGTVEVISVEAEAATDTITAGQLYGSVITNTGAVGAAVYTLPAPVVGMHFRVYLTVAQDVDINPADGTTILALTNAAGDAISSAATIGNCIELVALSSTTWAVFASSGTWTDAN